METRSSTNKEKDFERKDGFSVLLEKMDLVINKTDITNDLLRDLIKVCGESVPFCSQLSTRTTEILDEEETNLKTALIEENEVSSLQSPTQLLQREINELALQKEASKIKQKIKPYWNQTLNSRKQTYWKQINNANHAEQFEKWLEKAEPILPRKFRIKPIREEPYDQRNIRIEVAKERLRGEIQLLRLRSNKSQEKVIEYDTEMEKVLKNKASGRVLEILLNMWESDCKREEQKSFNKWRYKEAWLLDYERNYGKKLTKNEKVKTQQTTKTKPKKNLTSMANEDQSRDYAAVVKSNTAITTNNHRPTSSQKENNNTRYQAITNGNNQIQNRSTPNRENGTSTTFRRSSYERNYVHHNNFRANNVYKNNHVTYVGRNARNYFLGGGKPNQGANNINNGRQYRHQFHPRQTSRTRYV